MIRTIVSILITALLIFGLSFFEIWYVQNTFARFRETLLALHQKTEAHIATYDDGIAVRSAWENKKQFLHVWIPHSFLQEVEYQMDEAIGYLYLKQYPSALPKIEVLIGITDTIKDSYSFSIGNVF